MSFCLDDQVVCPNGTGSRWDCVNCGNFEIEDFPGIARAVNPYFNPLMDQLFAAMANFRQRSSWLM